jgi:hypothetical protein
MDRDVLDVIKREIDQEVRARFPGTAVRPAASGQPTSGSVN